MERIKGLRPTQCKKLAKPINKSAVMVVYNFNPSYVGSIGRRIGVPGSPGKNRNPI
jgi:hypothetical protein